MRIPGTILASLLAVSSGLFLPAAAQTGNPPAKDEMIIVARTQEKTADRIFLSGDVEVRYKDLVLFADRIEIDPVTKDCLAEGNATIQLPEESVSAERIVINLETRLGRMEKADGMVEPTIFYGAESIDKLDQDIYRLSRSWLTSCSQPVPRWKFSASKANFRKDEYVEMWNAVFRIKKVPLFYLPYMRYPLNKDRATGFLMPRIGYTENKGFNYEQSFYWVIARNIDATFNLDYYSARGVGGAVQTRYLFNKGTGGELDFYYFDFKPNPARNDPDSAYIIRFDHNQPLPFGFNLVAKVDLQSSYDFLREFESNYQRAIVSNRSSQVYLQKSWSHFNLSARVSRFETFYTSSTGGNSIISKSAPQVSFDMLKVRLLGPAYLSFTSSYKKWEYGRAKDYDKGTQRRSGDLAFSPMLSVPFTAFPWLTANASAKANFFYYTRSYKPGTKTAVDESLFTKNAVVSLDLVGPMISRVFRNKKGDPVFKHSIEPFAAYRYDSPVRDADRIITSYASFFQYHQVEYGIMNRFYVKENAQPRELVQMRLAQTYYLAPETGPLSDFLIDGKIPRFSEITGSLRYYPAGKFNLDASAGYNPYYSEISSLRLSANLGSRTDSRFLSVSWFKSTNTWAQDELSKLFGNRHQINAAGGLRIPGIPVEMLAEIDYNVQERKLLYTSATAVYHYQCLDFNFEFRVFYYRSKPETQFKFSLGLGNVGKTTDFMGGFGF
ncbi:MAG: LPS-assembly protein LptD [Candidatus Aminicenantales bacterium]